MVKYSKYSLLELYFQKESMSTSKWKTWQESVATFIFNYSRGLPFKLITFDPSKKRSIGYDIGKIITESKFNSVQYLITDISTASKDEIFNLVDTDEFYLGEVLILLNEVTDDLIKLLVINKEKSLISTGLEIIKMEHDGLFFYLYNPNSFENARKQFLELQSMLNID